MLTHVRHRLFFQTFLRLCRHFLRGGALAFLISSCSGNQDIDERSTISSTSSTADENTWSGLDDEDIVNIPSETTGSYIDFECAALKGNIACTVRRGGLIVPLWDSQLLGSSPPSFQAYLSSNIETLNLDGSESEPSILVSVTLDPESEWGLQLSFAEGAEQSAFTLGAFVVSEAENPQMGFGITIASDSYSPTSAARKFAVLDKCLLGYYLHEWLYPSEGFEDVTVSNLPASLSDLLIGGGIYEKVYDPQCRDYIESTIKDGNTGNYMSEFNAQMGELILDYFDQIGVSPERLDEIVNAYKNSRP